MPYITLAISPTGGPLVDLLIGVSEPREKALASAVQSIPQLVKIRGLIDTGASGTCIDPSVLQSLSIPARGTIPIHTPSTGGRPHHANQFDVSLVFPFPKLNHKFPALPVIEAHLKNQGIDALIGRDVLNESIFTYNGDSKLFLLGF